MASSIVTLEDTDSAVLYKPFADGDPITGWKSAFDGGTAQVSATDTGHLGIGNARHSASAGGASFQFDFYGTWLELIGDAHNSSFLVAVDGSAGTRYQGNSGSGVLVRLDNLSSGEHHVLVTLEDAQPELSFDRATFDLGVGSNSLNETVTWRETDRWQFLGGWNTHGYETTDVEMYDHYQFYYTYDLGARASLDFQGGTAVYLYGGTNWNRAAYEVDLDGKTTNLNSTSAVLVHNCVMYFQGGLDPRANHTLRLTNIEGHGHGLILLRAVIVHDNSEVHSDGGSSGSQSSPGVPSSSTSSTETGLAAITSPTDKHTVSVGAIVGLVIGAVAVLIGLLLVIILLRRNRRRNVGVQPHTTSLNSAHISTLPLTYSDFQTASPTTKRTDNNVARGSLFMQPSSYNSPSVPESVESSYMTDFSTPMIRERRWPEEFTQAAPPAYNG